MLALGSEMTLKDILNNIDKVLENKHDEHDCDLACKLEKHIEINLLIKNAAPYFDTKEEAKTPSCKQS